MIKMEDERREERGERREKRVERDKERETERDRERERDLFLECRRIVHGVHQFSVLLIKISLQHKATHR